MLFDLDGNITLNAIYLGDTVTPLTTVGAYIDGSEVRYDTEFETGRQSEYGRGWVRRVNKVSAPMTSWLLVFGVTFLSIKRMKKLKLSLI